VTVTTERPTQRRELDGSDLLSIAPVKRRQRNLPLALVATLCMAVPVVVFVTLQMNAGDRRSVLAVARPVEAGTVITDDDLAVAEVASDPALSPIPLAAKSTVVGATAAVDLEPGNLVVQSSLGQAAGVGEGEALVGIEVPASAAPISELSTGDKVQILEVAGSVLAEGRILAVGAVTSVSGGARQVSVVVPAERAPRVATASAAQQVALVVLR
jgi:flagella basal body P-ring formation protein FlgA